MEERQQQQQQQQGVYPAVLHDGIPGLLLRVEDRQQEQQQQQQRQQRRRRVLTCNGYNSTLNRRGVQDLVDLLQSNTHGKVDELELSFFSLSNPSDGGMEVLRDFFASDTTLSKVVFLECYLGTKEEASQILAAFETNTSVTDLEISASLHLIDGAALGSCISDILEHNVHLQRLFCSLNALQAEGVRSMLPGLRSNRHLKILRLDCGLLNDDLCPIADALVGNSTMEVLDLCYNGIASAGRLSFITRLVEFTRLKVINVLATHYGIVANYSHNEATIQRLIHVLQQNTSLEELPGINELIDSQQLRGTIQSILTRNRSLNRAKALLALQPRTSNNQGGLPIASKSGIWYKAMAKLAPNGSGASSIFDILQKRPALLERQLVQRCSGPQQPQQAASHQRRTAEEDQHGEQYRGNANDRGNNNMVPAAPQAGCGPKRQRLE